MRKRWPMIVVFSILILFGLGLGGCATDGGGTPQSPPQPRSNPLLVGVTPNYPPVIFKLSGQIAGLEADLARRLSGELRRPVEFVEVRWDEQISALLEGKTDMIMSGMTITEARQVRINFSQPYLKSGLMIAFATEKAPTYTSLRNIREATPAVGYIAGTTGEVYARNTFREENRMVPVRSAAEAALALKNRRMDIFVYDAPAVVWMVSENEAEVKLFPELVSYEFLGWGLRRDDRELLVKVNALISQWEKDGTLRETILKWLPYWKQF